MMDITETQRFCGRTFNADESRLIGEVTRDCGKLSRQELGHTVCELLDWKRPGGGLKARNCLDLCELMETRGILKLPGNKYTGEITPRRPRESAVDGNKPFSSLSGDIPVFAPSSLKLVENRRQRELFKELISRYHYLGYAMPNGGRLEYLAYVERPQREVVGCIQYSSRAWRMKADVRNLVGAILARCLKRLRHDWSKRCGVEPLLVETLENAKRFHGGCYRAANFRILGETAGRGRVGRECKRHGESVKTVMVYPLVQNAAPRLWEGR